VLGVDPVEDNVMRGQTLIGAHPQSDLVELQRGSIEDLPAPDWSVDCIFSRDMMSHIVDLDVALTECARVLRPDGALVVYQTFAGPRLEPGEAEAIFRDLATIPARMDSSKFEADAQALGFAVRSCEVIGSQWREAWEEDGRRVSSRQLLHAARLLRLRDDYVEELGDTTYRIELANALWGVYQMIGKLEPRVYVLGAPGCPSPARDPGWRRDQAEGAVSARLATSSRSARMTTPMNGDTSRQ
jgi:SAM-dependent methyltransferase